MSPAVVNPRLDFFDGWLAGDGCLQMLPGRSQAFASHCTSKLSYAMYVRSEFEHMGFSPHMFSHVRSSCLAYTREGGYPQHYVRVRAHPALNVFFSRWYVSNPHHDPTIPARGANCRYLKRFPPDFSITPDSLLQWYLGDGSLHKHHARLVVYLPDFSNGDLLIGRLASVFGSFVKMQRQTDSVGYVYFGEGSGFFSYVGPCPVSEYSYKWPDC